MMIAEPMVLRGADFCMTCEETCGHDEGQEGFNCDSCDKLCTHEIDMASFSVYWVDEKGIEWGQSAAMPLKVVGFARDAVEKALLNVYNDWKQERNEGETEG